MKPRHYDPMVRPGRRPGDCRTPVAEQRRVLLVGPDEAWRLLTAYVFEEAGFTVYAAADRRQAVAFGTDCCRMWWSWALRRPIGRDPGGCRPIRPPRTFPSSSSQLRWTRPMPAVRVTQAA